jgi:hypothetical protein
LWYNAPPAGSIVGELYHKLLLKMGVIIARNMFEVIGIINKPLLLHPVGVYIIYNQNLFRNTQDL